MCPGFSPSQQPQAQPRPRSPEQLRSTIHIRLGLRRGAPRKQQVQEQQPVDSLEPPQTRIFLIVSVAAAHVNPKGCNIALQVCFWPPASPFFSSLPPPDSSRISSPSN